VLAFGDGCREIRGASAVPLRVRVPAPVFLIVARVALIFFEKQV